MTERELLARTAGLAADYLESLGTRPVPPERTYREMHEAGGRRGARRRRVRPLGRDEPGALNQVLFRFADDATTGAALAAVQASGEAWMSGTTWDGRAAIRLSVSGWRTTGEDVDRTVAAFGRAVRETASD